MVDNSGSFDFKKHLQLRHKHFPTKNNILDQTEYYQKAEEYIFENLKPKSRKKQGGIGQFSFCFDCNGFLGSNYVRTYKKFAQIAMSIIQSNNRNAKAFEFDIFGHKYT